MAFNQRSGTVIGIDPDIDKNGVCAINRSSRVAVLYSFTFPETLEYLKNASVNAERPLMVFIEAGWMNHGNWHVTESRNGKWSPSAYAAAVGAGAGACHAVSKKLIECCEYYKIPVTPQRPLRKCWHGKDGKITHPELVAEFATYRIKHGVKRSNQETRDAALIALVNL